MPGCTRPLPQRPQRGLSLLALRSVEDQHPVQVVDLVLEDAGLEAGGLDQQRLTADVAASHPRVQRTLDVDRDSGQAEAALLGDRQLVGEPLQLRVDDRGRGGVEPRLHDQQAVHDAELGRRQPDAEGIAHDRDHLLGLALELGAEARHLRWPATSAPGPRRCGPGRAPRPGARARPGRARQPRRRPGPSGLSGCSSRTAAGSGESLIGASLGAAGAVGHCGSTSTLTETPRSSRPAASPSTASRTAATVPARRSAFSSS